MSLFNKFFNKKSVKNSKLAVFDSSFKKFDDACIPYACLISSNTGITKNGEIFQIIKIDISDIKANQENGIRTIIRKTIAENIKDLNTSFWINTVKRKKSDNITQNDQIENYFINRAISEYNDLTSSLNNFSTILYINIFRSAMNLNIAQKGIINQIFNTRITKKHDEYVAIQKIILEKLSTVLLKELQEFQPKLLSIIEKNGKPYSEILQFLNYLINFSDKEIPLDEIDIARKINSNKSLISNGIIAIKNDLNKIKYLSSFSLKEKISISTIVLSDIMNTPCEMIVTEFLSYVDQIEAKANFSDQIKIMKHSQSKILQEAAHLDFLTKSNKDSKFCKSSISFALIANSQDELLLYNKKISDAFFKYGIIAPREDLNLQRNYFAMMPGNFHFVHRMSIHAEEDSATFAYAYTIQDQDKSLFLEEKELFKMGTLKKNPFLFGIIKDKKNILISGPNVIGKTTFTNFSIINIINKYNARCYIIEFTSKSKSFIESIGGSWMQVSLDRQKNTGFFNPLNANYVENFIGNQYIMEFFILLLGFSNFIITPEISAEINDIITKFREMQLKEKNSKLALHNIRSLFKNYKIDNEIQSWHSAGKYYHIFDNKDDIFDKDENICLYIDETIQNNSVILTNVMNHILNRIINKKSDNPTILILDEPFFAFSHSFFKSKLQKILEIAEKNNIIIIFKIQDLAKEGSSIVDFSKLITSCGTQIHFPNKNVDDNYGRIFKLEKFEYMTINALYDYKYSLLIKQDQSINSCFFDLSEMQKTLDLLSDNHQIRTKIMSIKEELQTESIERWLPAFYSDFATSQENLGENIEKEIQATEKMKKILSN